MKRVHATVHCHQLIHARPAALLVKVGRRFPDTRIRLIRDGANESVAAELEVIQLMAGDFHDGDKVVVEAVGVSEALAAEVFRVALENLKDPDQLHLQTGMVDIKALEKLMFTAIDTACPDFVERCLDSTVSTPLEAADGVEDQRLAYLNDRLHNLTVPILPRIAWLYRCTIELRFETKSGIHICRLQPDSDELVIESILAAAPEAGTRITIVSTGPQKADACRAMQSVLNNLRQCDEWLRQRKADLKRDDLIDGLLHYASTLAELQQQATFSPTGAEINKLLNDESVIVYLSSSNLSKEEVLHQLVAVQSVRYPTLIEGEVLESVWRRERIEPVILREGLALPHAPIQHGPRIAISIAIVPRGVEWDPGKPPVTVIILFIYAEDTHRTYREHLAQLATIFSENKMLQEELVRARNSREVIHLVRRAEESLG